MSVVPLNGKDTEWTALAAIEYAKQETQPDSAVVVMWLTPEGESQWTTANMNTHQMLWLLEATKLGILLGD